MFYFNFIKFCNIVNKSPSSVAEENGIARSSVTRWSQGSMPRQPVLQKLANYFGCTVEDLLTDTPATSAPVVDGLSGKKWEAIEKIIAGTDDDVQDLLDMWAILQRNKNAPPEGRGGE